jgi:NAD(P)-dependent dehydrogenase (short-subunit alcohol dehydrogenase family)
MAQTVLVTGATSGLGRAVARRLSADGHVVLVHGRDEQRTGALARELPGPARAYVADLARLDDVRRLARAVRAGEERLDVLVNNAGVATTERRESADGIELSFAVNHLSHFVLTGHLLPLLRRSAPARVVNVASVGQAPIDWDDPLTERGWDGFAAYARSKLAQIAFTLELAERLGAGAGVTVTALHPATLMDTGMVRSTFGRAMSSVDDGVGPVVRLATGDDAEGISGRYYDRTDEARPHAQAEDPDERRRLWELSVRLAGEDPYA